MKVVIEPYNPLWPKAFEQEKKHILDALTGLNVTIEHIGSTSVEGLSAKPLIDILVGTLSEPDLNATTLPMIAAGYTYNKKYEHIMPYRRYFVRFQHPLGHKAASLLNTGDIEPREQGFIPLTHVHTVVYNSDHWVRHIAFREYLKAHQEVCKDYEQLKMILAQKEYKNPLQYSEAKNNFISEAEKKAMDWWITRG